LKNNNDNNLSLLLGFEKEFNPSSRENLGGLDPNVVALVNALTEGKFESKSY